MKWVMQYGRLARLMKGVSAKYMQRFYTSISIPRMLYAIDLFLILNLISGFYTTKRVLQVDHYSKARNWPTNDI